MNCSNCSHFNDGGKFCVKCGHKLQEEVTVSQTAAASEYQPQIQTEMAYESQQPNQHVEQARKISKSFLNYFVEGIKNPTDTARAAGENQFVNALITVILYALSVPLILYFGWSLLLIKSTESLFNLMVANDKMDVADKEEFKVVLNMVKGMDMNKLVDLNFTDFVFKQALFFFIGLAAIIGATYLVAKFGKVEVSFKEFFSRFGTFLIVPTALLLLGVVLALLHVDIFSYLMSFGLLSIFFAIPFTLASFKETETGGLDSVYSTLIVYVVVILVFSFISKGLIDEAKMIISKLEESKGLEDIF
ncbi:zinc ribbon domain-containing protein [Priestia megaterium]|uniref:zinc ribbon domain-containing protein n=1 Tax=Priestia megaterium TaxID=1404 RepID=UPI0030000812